MPSGTEQGAKEHHYILQGKATRPHRRLCPLSPPTQPSCPTQEQDEHADCHVPYHGQDPYSADSNPIVHHQASHPQQCALDLAADPWVTHPVGAARPAIILHQASVTFIAIILSSFEESNVIAGIRSAPSKQGSMRDDEANGKEPLQDGM